ncbi:hypothetical protein NFJ02_22g49700 [Pycnococcus provasolii]
MAPLLPLSLKMSFGATSGSSASGCAFSWIDLFTFAAPRGENRAIDQRQARSGGYAIVAVQGAPSCKYVKRELKAIRVNPMYTFNELGEKAFHYT